MKINISGKHEKVKQHNVVCITACKISKITGVLENKMTFHYISADVTVLIMLDVLTFACCIVEFFLRALVDVVSIFSSFCRVIVLLFLVLIGGLQT